MFECIEPGLARRDLATIACYFDDFAAQKVEWACEAKHLLFHLEYQADEMRRQAARARLLPLTRDRLRAYAEAHDEHRRALAGLLSPLEPDKVGVYDYFHYFLRNGTRASRLIAHYAYLHRDWCWGGKENRRTLALLRELLPAEAPLGRVLALGAGACRLPYDLHRTGRAEITVATDINPLLFLCAKRIMSGEALELFEFPRLPVDIDSCAVKRKLAAPAPIDDRFHLVLSDATRPCFRPRSFDTIVTSWFIDAVPLDIFRLFPLLNRLLDRGGTWLNLGPLMYKSQLPRLYSAEETIAIAEKAGFVVKARSRNFVPYLQSPSDCHRRVEGVVAFRAEKVADVEDLEAPSSDGPPDDVPSWIVDPSRPVQLSGDLRPMIAAHVVAAQVLISIDGQSGIDEIVRRVADSMHMSPELADTFVKRYFKTLVDNYAANPMLFPE
jgi:hypothetical protein